MREAVMRVAALEEALDHPLLERPPHAAPQRAVANKKPRHSFEPGVFRLKMAWR